MLIKCGADTTVKDSAGYSIVSILLDDEKKFEIFKLFADQA